MQVAGSTVLTVLRKATRRKRSIECIPLPSQIANGTVSSLASSRGMHESNVSNIDYCTSTAAYVHSGPVL